MKISPVWSHHYYTEYIKDQSQETKLRNLERYPIKVLRCMIGQFCLEWLDMNILYDILYLSFVFVVV